MVESSLKSASKIRLRVLAILLVFTLSAVLAWFLEITQMPLRSFRGSLPPLTAGQTDLRDHLNRDVKDLSVGIGERSFLRPKGLEAAAEYLSVRLQSLGYAVTSDSFAANGSRARNIEAIWPGQNGRIGQVIVGAHYDSVAGTVGANDNGTGVAAVLEIARLVRHTRYSRTIRFVFFVNEEPPNFQTMNMGSRVYADRLRESGVAVSAMISLETIGFYSDLPDSQKYPPVLRLFYPGKGNFIAFVGNSSSRSLVKESIRSFREGTHFPSEGIAAPAQWPGIGWSDQWSFWQEGYPGIMVTDTAPFRYPYYHTTRDTMEKIDFDRTTRVVEGMGKVIEGLASTAEP